MKAAEHDRGTEPLAVASGLIAQQSTKVSFSFLYRRVTFVFDPLATASGSVPAVRFTDGKVRKLRRTRLFVPRGTC